MAVWLSVIIPALNEEASLPNTLQSIQNACIAGIEIIVVDGGSADRTADVCDVHSVLRVESARGRARQMNAGAQHANGEVLLFLHADTLISKACLEELKCFQRSSAFWGRFNVALSGDRFMFRLISFMINQRSCFTGVATGDQGIFMKKQIFEIVGGFPEIPLMEDVEMSYRLNRLAAPMCSRQALTTSSRRWQEQGVWKTITQMWWLRWRYFLGAPAFQLARSYYPSHALDKER